MNTSIDVLKNRITPTIKVIKRIKNAPSPEKSEDKLKAINSPADPARDVYKRQNLRDIFLQRRT